MFISSLCYRRLCQKDIVVSTEDVAFTSYYSASDYPVSKVLQEYVYVEVGLIEQSDPDLHLQLRNCWVTTNENPYSHYRWDLLRDG